MTLAPVKVQLPPLHTGRDELWENDPHNQGGQLAVAAHPARFKVVICGRRWGKTTFGIHRCTEEGLNGKRVWWVAPTYKVAFVGWRMLRKLAAQLKDAGLDIEIREGDRVVYFPGGGEIWIKSADDPDSLRGEGLDGVVFDEVGQIKPQAWSEAIRPALSDKRGWAIFIGTPKGKNWLWQLWKMAETNENWARWRKPTLDNPYIDPEEIEMAKEQEPIEAIFKQEYEADFGASQLQVYDDFDIIRHKWIYQVPQFEYFIGGLDFGGNTIGSHKSAGVFGGVTAGDVLIELFEFEESGPNVVERQLSWMAQCESAAKQLMIKHKLKVPDNFLWKGDRSQGHFIDVVASSGYAIGRSKGGADSVLSGVNLVQRRLAKRGDGFSRWYYSPDLVKLPQRMEEYRFPDIPDEEWKVKPSNPLKVNDDLMDAMRYQIEGADRFHTGDPSVIYKNSLPGVA